MHRLAAAGGAVDLGIPSLHELANNSGLITALVIVGAIWAPTLLANNNGMPTYRSREWWRGAVLHRVERFTNELNAEESHTGRCFDVLDSDRLRVFTI